MFELTYSRKNIVRTVAIGFVLGSLVLSTGAIVVASGFVLFGSESVTTQHVLTYLLWFPLLTLFIGILLGWTVRLGLGLHAFWHYRRSRKTLEMPAVVRTNE